ncbi:MAG: hypothetical protein U0324_34385 [Polyangiales bacterium]
MKTDVSSQLVVNIDRKRYTALSGLWKSPYASVMSEEIDWYSNTDESILAVVLHDYTDNDYAAVVSMRDLSGRFRAVDVQVSFVTVAAAVEWLTSTICSRSESGEKHHRQGDEVPSLNLFDPVVPQERLHPGFVHLANDLAFLPGRSIIRELMPHYHDIDGNFVSQFQSSGFDARTWELYLFTYFKEEELFLDRTHRSPDFIVSKFDRSVAVEAVIVGRQLDNPPKRGIVKAPKSATEIQELQKDLMPIRFGSPLNSKLRKKYWRSPHVRGLPLIFAIADFHDDQSMLWSSTALGNYLYGYRHEHYYDESGTLVVKPIKINSHKFGDKKIPSGFFFLPGAENVSAVLFSASGTISKFNRLGRQAGFAHPGVRMFRRGTLHDHDPNASVPHIFSYEVDETSEETWGEGLSMFHNPKAKFPVPRELFPSIAHHYFEDGHIRSVLPEIFVYSSTTIHMIARDDGGEENA